jgi:hypothetical protein
MGVSGSVCPYMSIDSLPTDIRKPQFVIGNVRIGTGRVCTGTGSVRKGNGVQNVPFSVRTAYFGSAGSVRTGIGVPKFPISIGTGRTRTSPILHRVPEGSGHTGEFGSVHTADFGSGHNFGIACRAGSGRTDEFVLPALLLGVTACLCDGTATNWAHFRIASDIQPPEDALGVVHVFAAEHDPAGVVC